MLDIEKCKECYYADEDGVCEKSCLDNAAFEPKRPNERIVEWISIKDRLPKNNDYVLAWSPRWGECTICYWDERNEYWFTEDHELPFPSHWMPLPEPPKGE